MRRNAHAALLLVLLLACGESGRTTAPVPIAPTNLLPPIAGSWVALSDGITFNLALSESESKVTGNAVITSATASITMIITGTYVEPNVSLVLTTGTESYQFTGTQRSADPNGQLEQTTMAGLFSGSGVLPGTLIFQRQ